MHRLFRRKFISLLLTLFLFVTMAAGCTIQRADTEQGSQEAQDAISLSVWVFFDYNTPGTHYVDLWEELAKEYDCEIELKTYSTEQIKDKLKMALVCDELPDIFAVWGGRYADFLFDAGACIPVEDYLAEADFTFRDTYIEPYDDGHNYIIPCLVEAYAVTYCNQNLMEEMDLTMPETWEELLALVEAVNAYNEENGTDYAAIGLGNKDSWLGELLYTMIVNRIDPYALDGLMDGSLDFSDDVFVQAAEMITQLVEMGAFAEDFMETGEVESAENFAAGESVLFPHQSTIIYYLIEEMGEDAFTVEQFPGCSEEYAETYSTYMVDINHTLTPGLCISSDTEDPDLAAELCLEFAKRVNEKNVTEYDYLDLIEDSGLTADAESSLPVQQFHEMIDNAQKYTAFWYALLEKEDGDNWRNLTQKLLGGAIEVDTFIESAAQYLNFQ